MSQPFSTLPKSARERNQQQDDRLYLLSIQIDQSDATPLQGCVSDGSLFISYFKDKYPDRFEFKQIANHQATRDNILKEYQRFLAFNEAIRPSDITVLHVSAHADPAKLRCCDGGFITRGELEGLSRLTAKTSIHIIILDICHASSFFPDTQYPYIILAACGRAEFAAETTYRVQFPAAYGWFSLNLVLTLRRNPRGITASDLIHVLSNKGVNQQPRFYGPEWMRVFDSPMPSADSLRPKLNLALLSDQQILLGDSKSLKFRSGKHSSDRYLLINLINTSCVAFRRLDFLLKKEKDKDGKFLTFSLQDDLQPMKLQYEEQLEPDVPYCLYARAVQCHFERSECLSEKCAQGIPVDWIMGPRNSTASGKGR